MRTQAFVSMALACSKEQKVVRPAAMSPKNRFSCTKGPARIRIAEIGGDKLSEELIVRNDSGPF